VFWSPLLDRFGERRTWVTICCLREGPACSAAAPDRRAPTDPLDLLIAFTVSSATQDIAIDAFRVGIAAKGEEGTINSLRAGLYRLGVLAAAGRPCTWSPPSAGPGVFLALALASW